MALRGDEKKDVDEEHLPLRVISLFLTRYAQQAIQIAPIRTIRAKFGMSRPQDLRPGIVLLAILITLMANRGTVLADQSAPLASSTPGPVVGTLSSPAAAPTPLPVSTLAASTADAGGTSTSVPTIAPAAMTVPDSTSTSVPTSVPTQQSTPNAAPTEQNPTSMPSPIVASPLVTATVMTQSAPPSPPAPSGGSNGLQISTAPAAPTLSDNAPINFEDGSVDGWTSTTPDLVSAFRVNNWHVFRGTHALALTIHGSGQADISTQQGLSGLGATSLVTISLWIPTNAPLIGLQLYVTASDGSRILGPQILANALHGNDWNVLTMQIPANAPTITRLGLLIQVDKAVETMLALDSVSWTAGQTLLGGPGQPPTAQPTSAAPAATATALSYPPIPAVPHFIPVKTPEAPSSILFALGCVIAGSSIIKVRQRQGTKPGQDRE